MEYSEVFIPEGKIWNECRMKVGVGDQDLELVLTAKKRRVAYKLAKYEMLRMVVEKLRMG